ncbi:hypothetical protein [Massilia sp. CCM 8734]|uniref:hypothetical protein n=1 Tax=Massilia sp. CCM 8734 TaxID=2609283 RepID=UPI00141EEC70|nr:hypothetical protein [Massilia sp. CCM 8734]NHZ95904.1 hypothetical protein [Massilia sp. CCM 8734]
MKKVLLAVGLGLLCHAALAAVDDMHWFKTELTCADARLTVRAFCQETYHAGATVQFNSLCSRQSLVIERPGQRAVVRDLLERQSRQGEPPLLLSSLQCVAARGNIYLSGQMGNGGNCPGCERSVLLGLDGRWKRDGPRWLVGAQEKRMIVAQQGRWNDSEQVFITNTTPASACTVPTEVRCGADDESTKSSRSNR